jgi:AcrR family transcriptional regulator
VGYGQGVAEPRKRRANGEESRQRILQAAAEIAGERGYEGTSIALVSERSGLPASSIYWHFADKDALIAAVIERSYEEWLDRVSAWAPTSSDASRRDRMAAMMERTARALSESGDFLRLGLMLALERRPDEPSARRMFIQTREETIRRTVSGYARQFPELDADAIHQLATFTMAMADGLFVAQEIGGDSVDILDRFEMLASAILGAADHLAGQRHRARTTTC